MAKEIDVEQAKSWSKEEAEYNIKYLEDRNRFAQVDRIRELRGGATEDENDLEALTKDELFAKAEEQGVEVKASATKAELIEALQEG